MDYMTSNKASSHTSAKNQDISGRAMDTYIAMKVDQTSRIIGVLRLVEDLATRVLGNYESPDRPNAGSAPSMSDTIPNVGIIGTLRSIHADGNAALDRIEEAMKAVGQII